MCKAADSHFMLTFKVAPRHTPAVDEAREQFQTDPRLSFAHPFPATKLMFLPVKDPNQPDLLATTSDFLRIWSISDEGVALEKLLNNVSTTPSCS